MISVEGLKVEFGVKPLFVDASFVINDRDRIALVGKNGAGKSTLMEILTEGDGSSIGKGAQRTTRDIRKYTWNGLEITDVPGIGAFEGEDDEQLAFESAKTADLILFLIIN